ncbi:MAG: CBS domain-containing protein [Deltaproteobacteria bacterium]|nr:CBS domain-containing protein [Deltaproteobacteria bacterium]
MKNITIKDLMVPLDEYATVPDKAALYEAVLALEEAQEKFQHLPYKHRAVLVLNTKGRVVGKLSQLDIIKALEPKYGEMGDIKSLSRFGLSRKFISSIMEHNYLWDKPLTDLCQKAAGIKVKDFMVKPGEGEYVNEDASLEMACHQLVLGHHQSLLVTRGSKIVGILRLTDVFNAIFQIMKTTCSL